VNRNRELHGRPWRRRRAEVLAESNICVICGKPIDLGLPARHPMSATVDHRIARSLGGDLMDPMNLGPAHLRCNSSHGNRMGRTRVVSRRW